MSEPVLYLFGECLLSKWGFHDGDMPDWIADELEAAGVPWHGDWHATLCRLVREWLVPALAPTSVELVEIETNHNPIRASKVDGQDVENLWYGSRADGLRLLPESVAVPLSEVIRVYREALSGAVDDAERVEDGRHE